MRSKGYNRVTSGLADRADPRSRASNVSADAVLYAMKIAPALLWVDWVNTKYKGAIS